MLDRRTYGDREVMCLFLRCGKELVDDDTRLLKETTETCLLSASVPSPPLSKHTNLPPPIASDLLTTKPTHSSSLSPLPTTLIYSHDWSPVPLSQE